MKYPLLNTIAEGVAHIVNSHGAAVHDTWLIAESARCLQRGPDEYGIVAGLLHHRRLADATLGRDGVDDGAVALDLAVQCPTWIGWRRFLDRLVLRHGSGLCIGFGLSLRGGRQSLLFLTSALLVLRTLFFLRSLSVAPFQLLLSSQLLLFLLNSLLLFSRFFALLLFFTLTLFLLDTLTRDESLIDHWLGCDSRWRFYYRRRYRKRLRLGGRRFIGQRHQLRLHPLGGRIGLRRLPTAAPQHQDSDTVQRKTDRRRDQPTVDAANQAGNAIAGADLFIHGSNHS